MERIDLFASALGLHRPWQVARINISPDADSLDIHVEYARSSTYVCPDCGTSFGDVFLAPEVWFHREFLRFVTHLYARVPQVECLCGHRSDQRPWAGRGSRFVLIQAA